MSPTVSVVIPVKDGGRWLADTLSAVRRQADAGVELLVVDSGSSDASVAIARAAGATVVEIPADEFDHGRTRNLAAELATGELLCFLTQDAEPCPGWLDAFREAMELDDDIGAAFGPHLPRRTTSPMIARELRDFFAQFAQDGGPRVLPPGAVPFLSNVNACYRRACWEQLRFPDVPFAEDRAFAREMAGTHWQRAYAPGAAVLHAHDFGPITFIRRYFDEYAGLRAVEGYVEPFGLKSKWPEVRGQVARDRHWMREQGVGGAAFTAWSARSLFHHATRKVAMVAGTHQEHLPRRIARGVSRRGSVARRAGGSARRAGQRRVAVGARAGRRARRAAPLVGPVPGMADTEQLHVAVVIPPFTAGSGGHTTICRLAGRMEERGHTVTTWLHDPEGRMASKWPTVVRAELMEMPDAPRGPVFKGFAEWFGADVVLATGWDTAYRVVGLPGCRARAYLVQDDEARFFPASAQTLWATRPTSSTWLRSPSRHGSRTSSRRGPAGGRPSSTSASTTGLPAAGRSAPLRPVIFYARDQTPRRAVPLGMLALAELARRRPRVRFVLFGDDRPVAASFDYDHVGLASASDLARHYAQATVGLCLSLTNHSLVPHEMLACGLPCVELAAGSLERIHGRDGPIAFADADPLAIADVLERLLDDPDERERRSRAGLAAVAGQDWGAASLQLEAALRDALRARECAPGELPPRVGGLPAPGRRRHAGLGPARGARDGASAAGRAPCASRPGRDRRREPAAHRVRCDGGARDARSGRRGGGRTRRLAAAVATVCVRTGGSWARRLSWWRSTRLPSCSRAPPRSPATASSATSPTSSSSSTR